jgi:hypothetical protein
LAVRGVATPIGRYEVLEFEFAAGVLTLRCDGDTDEVVAEAGAHVGNVTSVGIHGLWRFSGNGSSTRGVFITTAATPTASS